MVTAMVIKMTKSEFQEASNVALQVCRVARQNIEYPVKFESQINNENTSVEVYPKYSY